MKFPACWNGMKITFDPLGGNYGMQHCEKPHNVIKNTQKRLVIREWQMTSLFFMYYI